MPCTEAILNAFAKELPDLSVSKLYAHTVKTKRIPLIIDDLMHMRPIRAFKHYIDALKEIEIEEAPPISLVK